MRVDPNVRKKAAKDREGQWNITQVTEIAYNIYNNQEAKK